MEPNRPSASSLNPAAKNRVFVLPARPPFPNANPHRPLIVIALPFPSRSWSRALPPDPGPLGPQLDELIRSGLMFGPGPELGRGLLPQTPVGPMVVVVNPPGVQRLLGVDETQEPMLREALLPKPAIERLDQGIVPGFTGSAEVEVDLVPVGPVIQGARGELGPIVDGDRRRPATFGRNPLQVG